MGGTRPGAVIERYLLPDEPVTSLDEYRAVGGGRGLDAGDRLGRDGIVDELAAAGLRGRGGGGFPTGRKWASIRQATGTHHYAVCNAAEGEPATFKDRLLIRRNPYQVVEGLVIASWVVGAEEAFIGLKASFVAEHDALRRAIDEMADAGLTAEIGITIVPGPDEYLFGEEKALLEVIEGKPPLPRLLPPFEHGLFATAPQMGWESVVNERGHAGRHESNPTLVNNVETLANVPHVLARGADWFRSQGTADTPGNLVVTVVGDVVRPGVAEVEAGTPLSAAVDAIGGGPHPGRRIKAVFSGVANAVVTAERLDTALSYDAFAAIGSGLGAAGFAVYDDTACMVEVARLFSRFLSVESCGQCQPCKLGSGAITEALTRLEAGVGGESEVTAIGSWLERVTDGARCYLATEERVVVASILSAFPDEFVEHYGTERCPRPRQIMLPKIVDLDPDLVLDERAYRKQPDWTYD